MHELAGKVALVTGAGRNIGLSTARTFAAAGAAVVCNDLHPESAEQAAADIRAEGGVALAAAGDVRSPAEMETVLDRAQAAFGVVNVLVNNAAITFNKTLIETTLEEWHKVLATGLTGPFVVTRAVARRMIDHGLPGAIVNMGSTLGHGGQPRAIAYSAVKGAILNFTRSLAIELAPHRIRVNSVSPGRSGTATLSGEPGELPRGLNPDPSAIPLGRYGNPQDQSNAILFLASDAAAFITGADLRVDGGALATWGDGK